MGRKKKGFPVHGWIILDKPAGVGSTPAVSTVKRYFQAQKAGHGGALDPFASGVLPIALGEATKTMPYILDSDKEYEFTARWGAETDTLDIDGAVVETSAARPTRQAILDALPDFIGEVMQTPPAYSSIKIDGRRAYDLARSGEAPEMQPRPVLIDALELVEDDGPYPDGADEATFFMQCGKGVYVRSLGRDLARRLGTVGHIVSLRRLRVGPFDIDDSVDLAEFSLEETAQREDKPAEDRWLLPIQSALDGIPALVVNEAEAMRLRNGQAISLLKKLDLDRVRGFDPGDLALATTADRYRPDDIAVGMVRFENGALHPVRVFNL